jgi:3-methyladenine DNA glycosylase AlkD
VDYSNITQIEYKQIVEYLKSAAEQEYKNFQQKLIPNVDKFLGVRSPKMKELAKEIAKGDYKGFLACSKDVFYEETMLCGLVIGNIKTSYDEVEGYIRGFVPRINNWAVCDSFCSALKIANKNKLEVWTLLQEYIGSVREFELRFVIVMLMDYFIDDESIDNVLAIYDRIEHDGYYVKMAVAWALSMCFVKFEDITLAFLQNNRLDDFTYNKALQKIIESNRVDKNTKETIRKMKRTTIKKG